MRDMRHGVVVGFDGSEDAAAAVDWAKTRPGVRQDRAAFIAGWMDPGTRYAPSVKEAP